MPSRGKAKACAPRMTERLADVVTIPRRPSTGVEWGRSAHTIHDYISGVIIRATPEEVDAVQVFSRRLVEDFGYSKDQIQTRPQYRVRKRPSGGSDSYPVDIAVFKGPNKTEDDLYIVVECKKKNAKEGEAQLKLYLDMSCAELGAWFNGDEHLYLRKVVHKDGTRTYQEIPNLPRSGQRIEDVGLFQRRDLRKPSNLKALFRDVRNHLAGNTTGIARDEALAQEIINILFCKIHDEIRTGQNETVGFRMGVEESFAEVRKRTLKLFDEVKDEYNDVFSKRDTITLDAASVAYVVGELQPYCIVEADRDAIGEAFEVFIGPALRGSEGQFFTPRNVVRMVVDILNPAPGEMILDPACGSGGFLITALNHIWKRIDASGKQKGLSERQIELQRRKTAERCFRGLDKDSFLAKVTKAYMAIIGDGRGGVFCENSLLPPEDWLDRNAARSVPLDGFDVVITNPPFGAKIGVKGKAILSQYDLAKKWKRNKGKPEPTSQLFEEQVPHILFLERCLQFLKSGGRLGIVLPESILGNPSYRPVLAFLQSRTIIHAVITLPESLFKTSGKGGTHTKVCVLILQKSPPAPDHEIFMSTVTWCGHDSRGNPTVQRNAQGQKEILDEVPLVAPLYWQFKRGRLEHGSHLGFPLLVSDIKNSIFVPKYYDPEVAASVEALKQTHDLVSVSSLVEQNALEIETGVEVGKMAYGTGDIPFVRTSDISNWEIKADFKHGVSADIYEEQKAKVDVRPLDILMVRDGTYLIGSTAMVTESDLPMLFQSHILRFRVSRPEIIDPWLLFVALNTPIVKYQIRSKQFTQDIIDTLGQRVLELVLPLPRDPALRASLSEEAKRVILTRAKLRDECEGLPSILQSGDAKNYQSRRAQNPDTVLRGAALEQKLAELEYDDVPSRFRAYAEIWRRQTQHMPSVSKTISHPAYAAIIGLGWDAVPLLLRELRDKPDHWLVALNQITNEDPAKPDSTFEQAVNAWLAWGRKRGML
jgi:type I restriction enzyme M protein